MMTPPPTGMGFVVTVPLAITWGIVAATVAIGAYQIKEIARQAKRQRHKEHLINRAKIERWGKRFDEEARISEETRVGVAAEAPKIAAALVVGTIAWAATR